MTTDPDTEAMQARLDRMEDEIEDAHERADDPGLDLPEVQQERSLIDPDGDGDSDEAPNAMGGL